MTGTYEVRLDIFEGPFQLLLSLITEQRLDVCDVPIARLTEDYLAHLDRLERADLEVTTEFLVVAATLLAIKARSLLPEHGAGDERSAEEEAERDLLIARLLEVRTFQEVGAHLEALLQAGDRRIPSRPAPDDEALRRLPSLADLSAADLARTLVEVVGETLRTVDTSRVVVDQVSTRQAAAELIRLLERGPVTFADVARGREIAWSVALFLAMLELAMRGEIRLGEGETVGDVELRLVKAS